jgi:hypothetical protein
VFGRALGKRYRERLSKREKRLSRVLLKASTGKCLYAALPHAGERLASQPALAYARLASQQDELYWAYLECPLCGGQHTCKLRTSSNHRRVSGDDWMRT